MDGLAISLVCGWHLLVLAVGVIIGIALPWRVRVGLQREQPDGEPARGAEQPTFSRVRQ